MVWCKSLARRRPCGSRRAAGDGLRSGPGDPDPNDGPAARFAAEAARYAIVVNGLFVASRLACEGPRSGPGDSDPNGDPDGSHRRVHPGSHSVSCASFHQLVGAVVRHPDEACEEAPPGLRLQALLENLRITLVVVQRRTGRR